MSWPENGVSSFKSFHKSVSSPKQCFKFQTVFKTVCKRRRLDIDIGNVVVITIDHRSWRITNIAAARDVNQDGVITIGLGGGA